MENFSTELNDDGILQIAINVKNEVMNVFNEDVMDEFSDIADIIDTDNNIKAVIFTSAKTSSFIAGADIKMLQRVETSMDGTAISLHAHELLGRIANSRKPHIAAIDGPCLGVGYELALSCHYRIASDNPTTKIGLPEVMLGLLPGGTGNSKLPRLIGLPAALDILLTGKQLNAKRALKIGMIDEVVSGSSLIKMAYKVALELINQGAPERHLSFKNKLLTLPIIKNIILRIAKRQIIKKTNGNYPATLAIIDVIKRGLNKPLNESLEIEASKFGELTISSECKQLVNIYFATTALKKQNFTKKSVTPVIVNNVGVLGGGLMGAGITTVSIDKANANVHVKDINEEGILSVYRYIHSFYQKRIKRKILSSEFAKKKMNQISSSLNYSGFEYCDLIIEAVFEDINLKHKMVTDIEVLKNKDIIFASNTSSIPLTDIASKAQRPEQIIGMHYFSPVEKMPLLEVVKHAKTSDKTISSAVEFGRRQGKTVIVVNDGAGFFVNRILAPYLNAAFEIGMDGIDLDKIDTALVKFGFPVGPFKLLDEVGLDVAEKISPILESAFGERMSSLGAQRTLISNGRLGKKVKKGFYRYDSLKKNNTIDKSVYKDLGLTYSLDLPEKNIVKRCIYRMLNEAAFAFEDGIIDSARDGDIGAIFGIGFPPFLGGPYRYMDALGISYVVDQLKMLEKEFGTKYTPCPLIVKMAETEDTFY